VHKFGHVPELLITFGLSYVVLRGGAADLGPLAVTFDPPEVAAGAGLHHRAVPVRGLSVVAWARHRPSCARRPGDACTRFPMTRAFMDGWRWDAGGAVAAADAHPHRPGDPGALTHPEMVEALGHNVPRVFMLVFGSGCALAGLAGVIGGITFVTEPGMAAVGAASSSWWSWSAAWARWPAPSSPRWSSACCRRCR
jgi:branched-chain amino acid transport system permease protein